MTKTLVRTFILLNGTVLKQTVEYTGKEYVAVPVVDIPIPEASGGFGAVTFGLVWAERWVYLQKWDGETFVINATTEVL